jgi:hypothetical protein
LGSSEAKGRIAPPSAATVERAIDEDSAGKADAGGTCFELCAMLIDCPPTALAACYRTATSVRRRLIGRPGEKVLPIVRRIPPTLFSSAMQALKSIYIQREKLLTNQKIYSGLFSVTAFPSETLG